MLLSAIDPSLLIYNLQDWQSQADHCLARFRALVLHRRMTRDYDQRIVISDLFIAQIYQHFPWKSFREIYDLRDLRQFIYEDLQRAEIINTEYTQIVNLTPSRITCEYVNNPEIIDSWEKLLCGCVREDASGQFDYQVATWERISICEDLDSPSLIIKKFENDQCVQTYILPLVWDEDGWINQLNTLEWWPNLHRCVELCFRSHRSLRENVRARETPLHFELTSKFRNSIESYCTNRRLRRSLIKAITKRVYGIIDVGLGDKPFGNMRRLRVTRYWRLLYQDIGDCLILEEFGPHNIGT